MEEKRAIDKLYEAIAAQDDYCERHNLPHFAPDAGTCSSCGRNIYVDYGKSIGYTPEYAASHLITVCPHCFRSFCD